MVKKAAKRVDNGETNPEFEERKRLKKLAHSNHLLSAAPADDFNPLSLSKTVVKHHGADIHKKSQRKNRYLFSFNGLLAPINGGKIGELTDLGSKNPTLYLDFPQGRMKLFGTIVYPSNRYLTLQFSGKNVKCEDYFDTMIVFSDACWVGKKEENPQENRLPFPVELYENSSSDYDFQGGAGATVMENRSSSKAIKKSAKEGSTDTDEEAQSPDRENNTKISLDVTPVRQSERTAGKRYKFIDASSGDNSPVDSHRISGGEDASEKSHTASLDVAMEDSFCEVTPAEDGASKTQLTQHAVLKSSSKKSYQSGNGRLIQATISTLLKKVNSKAGQSSTVEKKVSSAEKAGSCSVKMKKKVEVSDEDGSDDIEELSNPSQDSDEDWTS